MKVMFWRRVVSAEPPTRDEVEAMLRDIRHDNEKLAKYVARHNTNPAALGDTNGGSIPNF